MKQIQPYTNDYLKSKGVKLQGTYYCPVYVATNYKGASTEESFFSKDISCTNDVSLFASFIVKFVKPNRPLILGAFFYQVSDYQKFYDSLQEEIKGYQLDNRTYDVKVINYDFGQYTIKVTVKYNK